MVRDGGVSDPTIQLAPGVPKEQVSRDREEMNQSLTAAEANLKQMAGRQLGPSQQDAVKQVRTYMSQAREADKTGDVQRAQNLANKARILSEDLVRQ